MKNRIHIVSFDIPFPADYGGVIDVFSRVKWFSKNGWDVILHCFEYDRPRAKELEQYAEVHYYHRPKGISKLISRLPFIVKTRINETLEKILADTDDVVLLEGLHCAHYLNIHPGKFWLRTHNIEHEYYKELAKSSVGAKRLFFYAEVLYYHRPKGISKLISRLPFIVKTRINEKLEKILSETADVVLLEGLHCAHYLNLQPGKFWLRTHNIEHEYYKELAKSSVGAKRLFFYAEARKLKKYEKTLSKAKGLLVIAENEVVHFKKINPNSIWVPPLFNNKAEFVETKPYVLFHGNLSVEENRDAAIWISDKIVPKLREIEFIFAGKNPSEKLQSIIKTAGGKVVQNPSHTEMEKLINEAAVHLLWTKQASGVKLKFLNAMASSGKLICSPEMVSGSGLKTGFHVVNSAEEILATLPRLIKEKLTEQEWKKRVGLVEEVFGEKTLLGWLETRKNKIQ